MFHSAYIAITGLPNAGKSTLLNSLIGSNLAIISDKPQTTRNKILGIRTTEKNQMLFIDTPGWYEGKLKIDAFFRSEVRSSLADADIVLFLIDGQRPSIEQNQKLYQSIKQNSKIPIILVLCKMDALNQQQIIPLLHDLPQKFSGFEAIVPVSGKTAANVDELLEVIEPLMPEGPAFYPEDSLTDKSVPFLISEFVREAYLSFLQEELPFSIATVVEDFQDRESSLFARVAVYVERKSQKLILIGSGGDIINSVKAYSSMRARKFLGKKVNLEIWIKVKPNWRRNTSILNQIGYG
jgi:GTP-binding protein Era